jgi:integrase/recombinase XerD
MSDNSISLLRQRMIEDMTARRFKEKVQKDYVRHVRTFAEFLGRSPDTATSEDLRRFQLHMAQQQIGAPTINAAIAALRFFFTVTLERPDLVRPLRVVNEPRRAPVVLSPEEVTRLLQAAPGLKYKAALSVAYGAGLRVSEVAHLKVSDIDSQRMTLRVEQGKGQRDRYVMLSPHLLQLLREWWKAARPQVWLFPGQNPINAPFSVALRAFGFELRCAELPVAWRRNEAERSRVWIHAAWPVFDRHSSSACNARFTFRSAVSSS